MPDGRFLCDLNSHNRSQQHDGQSHSTVGAVKTVLNGHLCQKFWNFEVKRLPVEIKICANVKLSTGQIKDIYNRKAVK